jgi:bacterioferritin
MNMKPKPSNVQPLPNTGEQRLQLDQAALDAAKRSLEDGAVTPSYGPWRDDIVKLLNDALATELVCILRYKRHYYTAKGLASPAIAEEFMVHAQEETEHSEKIAERIVQLGGEPDFSPDNLTQRSHADYDESSDLNAMIRSNLVAERVAIEAYSQMIRADRREGRDDAPRARVHPQPGAGARRRTQRLAQRMNRRSA